MKKGFFIGIMLSAASVSMASPKIFVLSGGGSPAGNHHSQYLQTKTLADNLKAMAPTGSTTVRFAAGHNLDTGAEYYDVHTITSQKGLKHKKMIPGLIEGNAPATMKGVEREFGTLSRSGLGPEDSFFLIVSDHGMPQNQGDFSNNCIDLWSVKKKAGKLYNLDWENRCLSKNKLKSLINKNIPAKNTVFAMSQCFSGGFHQMSVTNEQSYPSADPKVCGFTAITQDAWASGCTPDVDAANYKGYERYLTEQVTGVDVVTAQRIRQAKSSLREAHEAATLEDLTVDIPLSTLDYYLWAWAKRVTSPDFKTRTKSNLAREEILQLYNRVASGKAIFAEEEALRKSKLITEMAEIISQEHPNLEATLEEESLAALQKKREELSRKMDEIGIQVWSLGRKRSHAATLVYHAFKKAVSENSVENLSDEELEFEKGIVSKLETEQSFDRALSYHLALRSESNPGYARNLARYTAQRSQKMGDWAENFSGDSNLAENARYLQQTQSNIEDLYQQSFELEKQSGLLRRIQIYKSAIGAWAVIHALKDKKAQEEIQSLIACQESKLPI